MKYKKVIQILEASKMLTFGGYNNKNIQMKKEKLGRNYGYSFSEVNLLIANRYVS